MIESGSLPQKLTFVDSSCPVPVTNHFKGKVQVKESAKEVETSLYPFVCLFPLSTFCGAYSVLIKQLMVNLQIHFFNVTKQSLSYLETPSLSEAAWSCCFCDWHRGQPLDY